MSEIMNMLTTDIEGFPLIAWIIGAIILFIVLPVIGKVLWGRRKASAGDYSAAESIESGDGGPGVLSRILAGVSDKISSVRSRGKGDLNQPLSGAAAGEGKGSTVAEGPVGGGRAKGGKGKGSKGSKGSKSSYGVRRYAPQLFAGPDLIDEYGGYFLVITLVVLYMCMRNKRGVVVEGQANAYPNMEKETADEACVMCVDQDGVESKNPDTLQCPAPDTRVAPWPKSGKDHTIASMYSTYGKCIKKYTDDKAAYDAQQAKVRDENTYTMQTGDTPVEEGTYTMADP